ncbi:MAG: DUF3592 domain-containing protein [Firmicutes bacterium]|nr:DUF3592 domain-containing protein [Bacillota bacterium]
MKKAFLIPKIMVIAFIIIGLGLFAQGVTETIDRSNRIEGYEETPGFYVYRELYSEADNVGNHKDNATYALVYEYYVSNEIYTVKTDYGTEAIPDIGYQTTIYYNPENPSEAVVSGPGGASALLVVGGMFVLVPLVMILGTLVLKGTFGKNGNRVMDLAIGFVFTMFSVVMLYMMAGSFSPAVIWMMAGPFCIIPIMMIVCGIIVFCRGLFL